LVTEDREGDKRVSFKLKCGKECEQGMIVLKEEIKKEIKEVIEKALKGLEEEKRKVKEM